MQVKIITIIVGTILLMVQTGAASAQDNNAVLVDIAPCLPLTADAERHACLDRLVDGVKAAQQRQATPQVNISVAPPAQKPSVPAAVVVPQQTSAQTAATNLENFGTETPVQARVQANEEGEQELVDRIATMEEREPDRWLITLVSGQAWYQTNSQRVRLRAGMEVRIYPSPLGGSYRMARTDGPSTGFIQVRRVQ